MLKQANGDVYKGSRAIRPLILNLIRCYNDLKDNPKTTEYLQMAYNKAGQFLPIVTAEIDAIEATTEASMHQYKVDYLKKFKKNLDKIKKLCRDTSITYYSMMPDNMPIDVRTYCVKFIAPATI